MKKMNEYIEDFLDGKIWIKIRKDQFELVKALHDIIPDVTFCDGSSLICPAMTAALSSHEQCWFRNDDNGVHYCSIYPRKADCYAFAPELYKNGEIINIENVVNYKPLTISDEEIDFLFAE